MQTQTAPTNTYTSATHRNNSNVSKVNYQHIARRPPVFTVYMTKIVHNRVKTGELQIDQNSSNTVIFAVTKNILIHL